MKLQHVFLSVAFRQDMISFPQNNPLICLKVCNITLHVTVFSIQSQVLSCTETKAKTLLTTTHIYLR